MKKIKNFDSVKYYKTKNGITLVALIITIIMLLILAVVTIAAVNEGNLFAHSNNAVTQYNSASFEENSLISKYISMIEQHDSEEDIETGKWRERNITNVQIGANKKYYCADIGNGTSYCIYLTENGDAYIGETMNDQEYDKWTTDEIDSSCNFTTANRMQKGSEYYLFNGDSIEIHLENPTRDFTVTLQPDPTLNWLQQQGLTSENVVFNKTYTCDNYTRGEGITATIEVTDDGVVLKENGTKKINYDQSYYNDIHAFAVLVAENDPENNDAEEVYLRLKEMFAAITSDYVTYAENGGSYMWLLNFSSPGVIDVYYRSYTDENEVTSWDQIIADRYHIGTFIASES